MMHGCEGVPCLKRQNNYTLIVSMQEKALEEQAKEKRREQARKRAAESGAKDASLPPRKRGRGGRAAIATRGGQGVRGRGRGSGRQNARPALDGCDPLGDEDPPEASDQLGSPASEGDSSEDEEGARPVGGGSRSNRQIVLPNRLRD